MPSKLHDEIHECVVVGLRNQIGPDKMTQAALAKKLGWSASELNDILRGRKRLGPRRIEHVIMSIDIKIILGKDSFRGVDAQLLNDLFLKLQAILVHEVFRGVHIRIGARRRFHGR